MRVLITGGSGLIGRALTHSLLADKHEVIILSRNPERLENLPEGVQALPWDAKTLGAWAKSFESADAVVHLAAESLAGDSFFPIRWTAARKQLILESRLQSGQAILQAFEAAKRKPGVLIQASAIGYYGPRGGELVDESAEAGEDFLAHVCKEWEAATAPVEALGVRRVVIRTGLVLSTQGGVLSRLQLPFQLFAGGPLGSGRQYYSWIHVDDYIAAIRFLLETPKATGAYNLTAPNPLPNRTFAKTMGKVLRRPSFFPVPSFVFRLLFGEVATVVLDGQRVVPAGLLGLGFHFQFPELEPALRDLYRAS